jgi:hypothetical protein
MPTYHHESSIGGGGNTTSSEVNNRKTAQLGGFLEEVVRSLEVLSISIEFLIRHAGSATDLSVDSTDMTDGLNNVTSTSLTLGTDESSTFADTAESLTEVLGTANVRDLEVVLVDVVGFVSGGKNLGLVNVINADGLDDLGLDKVTNTDLGHDGDSDSLNDFLDHLGVRHTGNATYTLAKKREKKY